MFAHNNLRTAGLRHRNQLTDQLYSGSGCSKTGNFKIIYLMNYKIFSLLPKDSFTPEMWSDVFCTYTLII